MATQTREDRYKETRDLIVEAEKFWGDKHKAMDRRIRFLLDGEHYEDSRSGIDGVLDKSRDSARWVGQEAFDVWRHEATASREDDDTVYARPLDEGGNEALGEIAVATVNAHIEDPMKMFSDVVDDVVASASACGVGWARIADWDPDSGPFGELTDEAGDPRMFMWDSRAKDPHEKRCRWIAWRGRMTKREALTQEGWLARVVKKLKADNGYSNAFSKEIETSERMMRYGAVAEQGLDTEAGINLDDEFTYYVVWRRLKGHRTKPVAHHVLDPDERYLMCESCHWQSPTQGEMQADQDQSEEAGESGPDDEAAEAIELPETAVGPCPQCGHEGLQRMDSEVSEVSVRGYPKFQLQIIAPYSGPHELIYDDEPEIAFRSFPVLFLSRHRHPTRPYGASVASLNAENQLCVDLIMDVAIERMLDSQPIWSIPDEGYRDTYDQRFEFTPENGRVMLRDPTSTIANGVELLEGTGIPAAWSNVYQFAMNALTAKTGITDFGIGTANSRDIPSSSVAQQIEQQELPLAHYKKRIRRAVAIAYGLIFDAERETDTEGKLRRLRGADGSDFMHTYAAADLPNFDFYLDSAPRMNALDQSRQKGFEQLLRVAQSAPWALDLYAEINHVQPSVIRKTKAALAQQQAQVAAPPSSPGAAGGEVAGGQPSPQDMVNQLLASVSAARGGPQPAAAPQ